MAHAWPALFAAQLAALRIPESTKQLMKSACDVRFNLYDDINRSLVHACLATLRKVL